jgi:hypothetical protein
MNYRNYSTCLFTLGLLILLAAMAGCQPAVTKPENTAVKAEAPVPVQPQATPGKFTAADIAKLKWLEGAWRGTGDKQPPFFERYKFEGTTMIVENFADETLQKVTETSRFELVSGEFGNTEGNSRAAASTITDTAVQFVPVVGSKNSFRFEKQSDGTWQAVIEEPSGGDKPAAKTIYKMEPLAKK